MPIATVKVRFILPDLSVIEYDSNFYPSYHPNEIVSIQTGEDEGGNPTYTPYRIGLRNHFTKIQNDVVTEVELEFKMEDV